MNLLDYIYLAIKSICSLITIYIFIRLQGKKQISQLNIFDYIIGISMGNIAAEISIDKSIPLLSGIMVMAIYSLVSLLISYLTMKSIKLRKLISGKPVVLMQDGKIIMDNLRKVKFDINDFLQESRSNGYFDISELEYALMEDDGRISFLPKSKYIPLTPNDMKIKTKYKGLTANLVIDGHIMPQALKSINKNEKWLLKRIENNKITLDDILLLTINSREEITIYPKKIDFIIKECLE